MKAAVFVQKGKFEVMNLPDPHPEPGEVVVRLRYCGICGSDTHIYEAGFASPGAVLGHEWSAEVVEVGKDVTDLKVGDPVIKAGPAAASFARYVPQLPAFTPDPLANVDRRDSDALVEWLIKHPSMHAGGYAEYIPISTRGVSLIPEGISYKQATFYDPVSVALGALRTGDFRIGQSAVVVGAGPIGLLVAATAKLAGASQVIVSEIAKPRIELARKFGADVVLNPRETDVEKEVLELTNGQGADVVFECAGTPQTFQQSVNLVKRFGRVAVVSIGYRAATVMPAIWFMKAVDVKASVGGDGQGSLHILQHKKIDVEQMITGIIPVSKINDGFADLLGNPSHAKILVQPDDV